MTSKGKAKSANASSFLDLKAEIAKREAEFTKNKAAGNQYVVGGVKRPDKKPTVWQRQNKGVDSRASRDAQLEAVSKPTLESARSALERKAKIYEKLRKGKTGGLNDKQYESLLVDFDSKPGVDTYESDSDDVDESLTVPKRPDDDDDPVVEYEDEFGRIRTARRSEVPRDLLPAEDERDEDEDIIIRNPVNHFPTYEPTSERIAEVAAAYAEENNPLNLHYDASREVRAKGAGFYQFSGDEETRKKQMEELKTAREETGKVRQELGAVDVRPGEVEGMTAEEGGGVKQVKSKAMEKRKRELEERRKLIEAKRRKVGGQDARQEEPKESALRETQSQPIQKPPAATSAPFDPMAALEVQSQGKTGGSSKVSDADMFLAQLEKDFLAKKGR